MFLLHEGAISWACKKQAIIALSTTEAEYMATTAGIQESVWVKNFIEEIFNIQLGATQLFCDNKGALSLLINNSYSSRTKHIDIKTRYIRENIENRTVTVNYLPTNEMPADILTKAVSVEKIRKHSAKIGLNNPIIN